MYAKYQDSKVLFEDDEAWHKSNMSGVGCKCFGEIWIWRWREDAANLFFRSGYWQQDVEEINRENNKAIEYRLQSMR